MKSYDILVLGSSYLTELSVKYLLDMGDYNLVGYVPCKNTPVEGDIPLKRVDVNHPCDIKLSLQYDIIVEDTSNTYNLHTGLLPQYGGRDILDHTIKNKEHYIYQEGSSVFKFAVTNMADISEEIMKKNNLNLLNYLILLYLLIL